MFNKKLFLLLFVTIFLSACSSNKINDNKDLSPYNLSNNNSEELNLESEFIEENQKKDSVNEDIKQLKDYQKIYISENLNIKFIYAKKDPLYNQDCEISEKDNTIYNSCGYSVEVARKDPGLSNLEVVNSLIKTENQDYCEILEKYDNNFKNTYQILPIYNKIPDNLSDIFDICGKYTSHYLSNQYKLFFDPEYLNYFLIIKYGGHEPQGVLDVLDDGSLKYWFETIEFINNNNNN